MSVELVPANLPSVEVDPVQHMTVVLNRAKGWLEEARSIDDARQLKAMAVGYESVLREKELAFDAQLAATEIVRRCERRIGELVREGQDEGTIAKQGQTRRFLHLHGDEEPKPAAVGSVYDNHKERSDSYAMADAPAEQFEQAIIRAREEGNLSRANVVRKVKGEAPQPTGRSEWHHKRPQIDSNRVLSTLAQELDAATSGLELMEPGGLDPDLRDECVVSIKRSISRIHHHLRRIQ